MPQWGRRGPGQVHFLLSPNHRERLRYGGHLPWIRDAQGTCWYLLIKVKLRENVTYFSLFFFSYRSNISGSHSYPLLSKKNQCGVYKNGNSPSYAFQPRFILISSRIPAYEVQSALRGQAFSESVGQDVRQAVFWLSCVKMIHLLTEN